MKTTHDNATELLNELTARGFKPARWDRVDSNRQFDLKNEAGHTTLRVCLNYEGSDYLDSLDLIKFNGTRAMLPEWQSTLSAHMPLEATLALIAAV